MQVLNRNAHIIRYDDVESTHILALEYGRQGAAHGTVVTAIQQSCGRGRLERSFFSPPGGLYFSIVVRPPLAAVNQSLPTLAAGVICSRIVERASGLSVMLKWPNDLYLENRKLGGILTEAAPYSHRAGKIPFLVIGIGLNINTRAELFPGSLRNNMISLYALQKREYELDGLMTDIADQICRYVSNPVRMRQEILAEWRKRDYLYGRSISWQKGTDESICGTGSGLLDDGRYRLQTAEGKAVHILGGELKIMDSPKG